MKKIITIICITALLATLTACNNGTAPGGGNSTSTPGNTGSIIVPENS